MNGLPLHPALVHLPLGLAMILPLAAAVATFLVWRGRAGRALLAGLAVGQAVLVISGWVAMQAGESDEDPVEKVVGEAALEAHEERAEGFVVAGAAVLVALTGAAVLARQRVGRVVLTVGAAGTIAVLALGLGVGHSGGELVYVHGAAQAHLPNGPAAAAPRLETRHDDDD